jgi:hypothetical protein
MNRSIGLLTGLLFLLFLTACQKELSHETGSPAKGSLQSSSGECLPKNIGGNFIVNKTLNDSNFLEVTVNITQTGSFNMSTDTVNGYYFSGSGVIGAAGTNTIRLKGVGKPNAEGTDIFTVKFDTTICTLAVTVLPIGSTGGSGDHFPLTANSWWSYQDPSSGDTLKTVNTGTASFGGNDYKMFVDSSETDALDSMYYRKDGNNYYEYGSVDKYSAVTFNTEQKGDILFLKEGLQIGDTWSSAEYSGVIEIQSVNQDIKLKYTYTCTDNNATKVVNSKTFNNVYVINFKGQVSVAGAPYIDDGVVWTVYYAQNIGLIYQAASFNGNTYAIQIKNWQVF